MKTYSQLISEITVSANPKFKKPSKNDDRAKAKDRRTMWVTVEGPNRKEKGMLWYVPSEDGPAIAWAIKFAAETWGTAPWVVHTFRIETSRVGDGVVYVRHADCVKHGFTHWKKFSASPNSTF